MEKITGVVGWTGIIVSTLLAAWWAWWGTLENFHEGWYHSTLKGNLLLSIAYLLPSMLVISSALLGIKWPRVGGGIHMILGLFLIVWWLWEQWPPKFTTLIHITILSGICLMFLGACYIWGKPESRKIAALIVVGFPCLISVVFAVVPLWRVLHRVDDGQRSIRDITENGVSLTWAPLGPGWPRSGNANFKEAERIASHLSEDGMTISDSFMGIWRLPTVAEVVQSLTRDGKNVSGKWNSVKKSAYYDRQPDKETPLWNPTSTIIYWWTSSRCNDGSAAYVICYNGKVKKHRLNRRMGSLGFRAVRDISVRKKK